MSRTSGVTRPTKAPPLPRSSNRTSGTSAEKAAGVGSDGAVVSDEDATAAYIRRILCSPSPTTAESPARYPSESLHDLLPPLTSSNSIDTQLYAFIAVILSNFVQVWYHRITPDQQFVNEIVHLIAHCTRGVEQRLRQIDLEELLLDELPELLSQHVQAIRLSRISSTRYSTSNDARIPFLALRPHPALEPVPRSVDTLLQQQENELAWCLLVVNRVLPLLLPPEHLQNPCLNVLVSEVFSELIFRGGICGKASEPWLIWDGISKVLQPATETRERKSPATVRSLERSGSTDAPGLPTTEERHDRRHGRLDQISTTFWYTIGCAMALWSLLRTLLRILLQASTLPLRVSLSRRPKTVGGLSTEMDIQPERTTVLPSSTEKHPILDMHIWQGASQLLLLDRRAPWLSGLLSLSRYILLSGPGKLCATNSRLDRYCRMWIREGHSLRAIKPQREAALHDGQMTLTRTNVMCGDSWLMSATFHDRVLSPTWLPPLLRVARSALFPDYTLAPARIPPTSDEIALIKRGCAEAIVDTIPPVARRLFFATTSEERMIDDIEDQLDLLADPLLNKHLIISAVDLIVVRLFPELA